MCFSKKRDLTNQVSLNKIKKQASWNKQTLHCTVVVTFTYLHMYCNV